MKLIMPGEAGGVAGRRRVAIYSNSMEAHEWRKASALKRAIDSVPVGEVHCHSRDIGIVMVTAIVKFTSSGQCML